MAVVLAAAAVGMAAGALVPPPRAEAGAAAPADWALPPASVLSRVREAEVGAVRSARIVGEAQAATGAGVKPAAWKLTGIMVRPVPAALIQAEGTPPLRAVRVGETLPGGGVVLAVSTTRIRFKRDACVFERALYSAADTTQDPKCSVPASPGSASAPRPGGSPTVPAKDTTQ